MTDAAILESFEALQKAVHAFLDNAAGGEFGRLSDAEFTDLARDLESLRRTLETADNAVIAEVKDRDLPVKDLTRHATRWLSALWRLTPAEAYRRAVEAKAVGPRVALTGQRLEPLRPRLSAARRAGVTTGAQTRLIARTLDALPAWVPVELVDEAERNLVDAAHAMHLDDLRRVCVRLLEYYDPDGREPDDAEQQRRRFFDARPQNDGMVSGAFRLDGVIGSHLPAFLAANAKPRPTDESGRDERTPGQRRADAIGDLLGLAERAGEHATATGTAATLQIPMGPEQFETKTGTVWTSFGTKLSVTQAFRMLDQCQIGWLVHNSTGGILNYGRSRRCASTAQAAALAVRDGGCAFPGCSIPPEWCEKHHIKEWQDGGETNLDILVLLCGYHHRRHLDRGWRIVMVDKVPHLIPPGLVDPLERPLRNTRGLAPSRL